MATRRAGLCGHLCATAALNMAKAYSILHACTAHTHSARAAMGPSYTVDSQESTNKAFKASAFPKKSCMLTLSQGRCRAGSCQANWARSGYWDSTFRQICCVMSSSCCSWTSPCALDLQRIVWTSALASSWMKSVCHSRCVSPAVCMCSSGPGSGMSWNALPGV